jgi:hypothetical protein
MDTLSYPSRSALSRVKKVRIKVNQSGSMPPLIDEVIKQLAGGELSTSGGEIEAVHGSQTPYDALLCCTVSATPTTMDDRERPTNLGYLMHFDLLTTVASLPQNELVVIWSQVAYGHVDAGMLYTVITQQTQACAARLVSDLLGH